MAIHSSAGVQTVLEIRFATDYIFFRTVDRVIVTRRGVVLWECVGRTIEETISICLF